MARTKWCVYWLGLAAIAAIVGAPLSRAAPAEGATPGSAPTTHDPSVFRPDPRYPEEDYDTTKQLGIYGGKSAVPTPRPVLEFGTRQYTTGPFDRASNFFGELNPSRPALSVYGDWRSAVARNDNGGRALSQIATRLNLDIDFKLTSTERIHAFMRPLDRNGKFTRYEFSNRTGKLEFDLDPETLFFEGDLGAIAAGFSGNHKRFDLPFAVGLMPLVFQNGIWVDDAFTGLAFSIPALNSPRFDISNADITFFAAFDKVTTGGIRDANNKATDSKANVFGVAAFVESNYGYWEAGYGYTQGHGDQLFRDQSYHNVTAAFTRRYFDRLSNSVRVIGNFGQDPGAGQRRTADGYVVLIENSLVTSRPVTLVPYMNLFLGVNHPQSLARDAGAGGVLKNTGINFETDGLTGFPLLDDTANDTYGGALGVEYLFDLNQQVILEYATVQVRGDAAGRFAKGDQNALGVRYQRNLTKAWLFRFDAMAAKRQNDNNISGVRAEVRLKF